jgi:hypothetical protein
MSASSTFDRRFEMPEAAELESVWQTRSASVLGAAAVKQWADTATAQKAKEDAEILKSLKPSEQQARFSMQEAIDREVLSFIEVLELPEKRQQELRDLARTSIEAALKEAMAGWEKSIRRMPISQRKEGTRTRYFGYSEEMAPQKQAAWQEGIAKLFTAAEREKTAQHAQLRKEARALALSSVALAEVERHLPLNQAQRVKLLPAVQNRVTSLVRDEERDYWSYQVTQLYGSCAAVEDRVLREVLDESQMRTWKMLGTLEDPYRGGSTRNATPEVIPALGEEDALPDVEQEISRHLAQLARRERERSLKPMLALVEDAARLLQPPTETLEALRTSARGAVEHSMNEWRSSVEGWIRGSASRASPQNIRQMLAGLSRSTYRSNRRKPEESSLWLNAVKRLLTPAQQQQWNRVLGEREDFALNAKAQMTLSELDRRRHLSSKQLAAIRPLLIEVLRSYQVDMEQYMSWGWHLQSYYALMPLAGVPEEKLKPLFTEEKWKAIAERDLAECQQYWDGIQQMHERRLKMEQQGGEPDGGGFFFSE